MFEPGQALRLALRPSSVVATLLLVLAVCLTVRGDLQTRPVVRLEVDTGGPIAEHAESRADPSAVTLTKYHVRPGDTLTSVAALHDVDPAAVVRANALHEPYHLTAGDVLRIPDVAPAGAAPPPDVATTRTGMADLLATWARTVDLPADLLQAVTWRESSWRQDAVSNRGALGVGQLLPDTATWVSSELAGGRPLDPHDLESNAELSARYLRWLVDRYGGDVAAALAAYHQGPRAVDTDGWYPSTSRYVSDVFRLRRAF
ncbi:MAG TPA: transglycosylase SLT domain-containing protein [Acidimicrobiales bacterium]|jgi:soluble lytic murein transglycosylase-like protein|nr:transglycosylase SLT domain-containing protein [Acidimicrobiales bacterium]